MTIVEWLADAVNHIQTEGLFTGLKHTSSDFYLGYKRRYANNVNYGTNIYDREWDVLIILDGCRLDLLESVADEEEFLTPVSDINSVGTASREWIENTFTTMRSKAMSKTAMVTGNVWSRELLDHNDFDILDEAWKYGWDHDLGTMDPEVITHRGIQINRKMEPDRLILHYMQPHYPFYGEKLGSGVEPTNFTNAAEDVETVWDRLEKGEVGQNEVWTAYQDNLRHVLQHVGDLLENIEAEKVVISADHGNAMGEYDLYGHQIGMPIEPLVTVPWVETKANDTGSINPPEYSKSKNDSNIEEKLRHLGYRT